MGKGRRWAAAWVFLFVLLGAGCGGDDGAAAVGEEPVVVTPPRPILRWMGPAFVRPVDRELVARCGKEAGMVIELLPAPANPVDRLGLYRQFLPAESDDIDLIDFDVVWSGTLAPHLLDLNPYLTARGTGASISRSTWRITAWAGALVGLPQMGDIGAALLPYGPAGEVRFRGSSGYVERAGGDGGGDPGGGTGGECGVLGVRVAGQRL